MKEKSIFNAFSLPKAFLQIFQPVASGAGLESNLQSVSNTSLYPADDSFASTGADQSQPQAYLNYVLLDKNFNLVTTGFKQVDEGANGYKVFMRNQTHFRCAQVRSS